MPLKRHPVALPNSSSHLARLPLDTALVARLRATYERVRTKDLRLAELFYLRLFAAAPHLRPLFKGDLQAQAQKLTAALDAVVQALEKPEENAAKLAELGARHAQYGARPEHYTLVVDCLIESMRELLGPDAGRPALDEWRLALRLISDQMIAGAAAPPRM